jgi:HlyD family secretion protein
MDRPIPKRRSRNLLLITALVSTASALAGGFAWWYQLPEKLPRTQTHIQTVQEKMFERDVSVSGEIVPSVIVTLTSNSTGIVSERFVENGQTLTEGASVVRLKNSEIENELSQQRIRNEELLARIQGVKNSLERQRYAHAKAMLETETNLANLSDELESKRALSEEGFLPRRMIQELENEIDRQKALMDIETESNARLESIVSEQLLSYERSLQEIQSELRNTENRARQDLVIANEAGQLSDFELRLGDMVSIGQRIGEIRVLESPQVIGKVDEFYADLVQVGQAGQIDYRGQEYELVVSDVNPQVEQGKFEVTWEWRGKSPEKFLFGQSVLIRHLLGSEEPKPVVKLSDQIRDWGSDGVYVLGSGESAQWRDVKLGRQSGDYIEVVSGLSPGDVIAIPLPDADQIKKRRIVLY